LEHIATVKSRNFGWSTFKKNLQFLGIRIVFRNFRIVVQNFRSVFQNFRIIFQAFRIVSQKNFRLVF
jgi:hypothetical protein